MEGPDLMRWPWQRHRDLDERVAQARAEAEASRRALEQTRAQVVGPSVSFRDRNGFAEIIKASLLEGRDRH